MGEATFMNLLQQQRAELALVVKSGAVQLEERLQSEGVAARNDLLAKIENERAKALRDQFIAFDKQVQDEAEKTQLEIAKELEEQKKTKFSEQEKFSELLVQEIKKDLNRIKSATCEATAVYKMEQGFEMSKARAQRQASATVSLQAALDAALPLKSSAHTLLEECTNEDEDDLIRSTISTLPATVLEH